MKPCTAKGILKNAGVILMLLAAVMMLPLPTAAIAFSSVLIVAELWASFIQHEEEGGKYAS
jgi:hypothetical protein